MTANGRCPMVGWECSTWCDGLPDDGLPYGASGVNRVPAWVADEVETNPYIRAVIGQPVQPQRSDAGGSESPVAPGLLAGVVRPVPPASAVGPLFRLFVGLKVNKTGGWCLDHHLTPIGNGLCGLAYRIIYKGE
jgi:hypothetical protein